MSDILDMVLGTLTEATNQANAVAEKIGAATTDRSKRVHELRTDPETTDPTIKALQEWLEKANAQMEAEIAKADEYIKGKYLTEVSEEDVNSLKEEYKSLKEQVNSARKFAATIPGFSEDALKDVPDLKSLRGGTSGGGTGGKRPRIERLSFSTKADGPWTEVERDGKTNFTLLAQRLSSETKSKVEVKDLQAAAFESAGTDDLSTLNGSVFTFAHSIGDATYWVMVQPVDKSEAKAEDNETEDADSEPTDNEAATE